MAKREFLMLAHDCDEPRRLARWMSGWFVSEKLDGMRAFWDGGVTRGRMPRFTKGLVATGLWTRYGKIIYAPRNWLDKLPPIPLDGELWTGRNQFQKVVSITKQQLNPSEADWAGVKYRCFDSPGLTDVWEIGLIDNPQVILPIDEELRDKMAMWANERGVTWQCSQQFNNVLMLFANWPELLHQQLPWDGDYDRLIEYNLANVTTHGGEGLMMRAGNSVWTPERSWNLLKIKTLIDSEATVVGYTFGRETNSGSKLLGLMGALKVEWQGKYFDLSGFTDEERRFEFGHMTEYAQDHPGEVAPAWVTNATFPRGSTVTFQYRTLTKEGLPREAKYWRKYEA
jgi:DNA ligase-1